MTASHAAAIVLLAAGTASLCLSSLGLLAARTPFAGIHLLGPAAILGVPLIAASIVVRHGFDASGTMSVLAAVTLLLVSPVQAHALARALRIRQFGHWIVLPGEERSSSVDSVNSGQEQLPGAAPGS